MKKEITDQIETKSGEIYDKNITDQIETKSREIYLYLTEVDLSKSNARNAVQVMKRKIYELGQLLLGKIPNEEDKQNPILASKESDPAKFLEKMELLIRGCGMLRLLSEEEQKKLAQEEKLARNEKVTGNEKLTGQEKTQKTFSKKLSELTALTKLDLSQLSQLAQEINQCSPKEWKAALEKENQEIQGYLNQMDKVTTNLKEASDLETLRTNIEKAKELKNNIEKKLPKFINKKKATQLKEKLENFSKELGIKENELSIKESEEEQRVKKLFEDLSQIEKNLDEIIEPKIPKKEKKIRTMKENLERVILEAKPHTINVEEEKNNTIKQKKQVIGEKITKGQEKLNKIRSILLEKAQEEKEAKARAEELIKKTTDIVKELENNSKEKTLSDDKENYDKKIEALKDSIEKGNTIGAALAAEFEEESTHKIVKKTINGKCIPMLNEAFAIAQKQLEDLQAKKQQKEKEAEEKHRMDQEQLKADEERQKLEEEKERQRQKELSTQDSNLDGGQEDEKITPQPLEEERGAAEELAETKYTPPEANKDNKDSKNSDAKRETRNVPDLELDTLVDKFTSKVMSMYQAVIGVTPEVQSEVSTALLTAHKNLNQVFIVPLTKEGAIIPLGAPERTGHKAKYTILAANDVAKAAALLSKEAVDALGDQEAKREGWNPENGEISKAIDAIVQSTEDSKPSLQKMKEVSEAFGKITVAKNRNAVTASQARNSQARNSQARKKKPSAKTKTPYIKNSVETSSMELQELPDRTIGRERKGSVNDERLDLEVKTQNPEKKPLSAAPKQSKRGTTVETVTTLAPTLSAAAGLSLIAAATSFVPTMGVGMAGIAWSAIMYAKIHSEKPERRAKLKTLAAKRSLKWSLLGGALALTGILVIALSGGTGMLPGAICLMVGAQMMASSYAMGAHSAYDTVIKDERLEEKQPPSKPASSESSFLSRLFCFLKKEESSTLTPPSAPVPPIEIKPAEKTGGPRATERQMPPKASSSGRGWCPGFLCGSSNGNGGRDDQNTGKNDFTPRPNNSSSE